MDAKQLRRQNAIAGVIDAYHEEILDNVAAADVDYIKTTFNTAATARTFNRLDGGLLDVEMDPPRNVTITSSSHANHDAVAVVITGIDVDGNAQTDTITKTDAGNATDAGAKAFRRVDSVTIPAEGGTSGTMTIGFGAVIGLRKPIRATGGLARPLEERAAGSVVTNGTFVTAATSPPHGTYAPNTAPNGTNDYFLLYRVDDGT